MTNTRYKKYITEGIAALLVLLLLYTSIEKLRDYDAYRSSLEKLPLIGNYSSLFSWFIPFIELFTVTALTLPATRKLGLLMSGGLLLLFAIYIGYMRATGIKLPCTCGTVFKQFRWNTHLLFNVVFAAMAFVAVYLGNDNKKSIAIKTGAAEYL